MPSPSDADSRSAKLKSSFQNLSAASLTLNTASNAFGSAISTLDDALSKLNPGVSAWVTVLSTSGEETPWETDEERLGYTKLKNRWGLALCTATLDQQEGTETVDEVWAFNDAPRSMRLRALNDIPRLLEALAKEAAKAAKEVEQQARHAEEIAKSIEAIANEKGNSR